MSDDDARRKQKRDVDLARKRRADRRKARLDAWDASQREAREGREGSAVASVTLAPIGSLLDDHVRRLASYLSLLEFDSNVGLPDKIRLFVMAVPALAKGAEALEIRERIEALEADIRAYRDDERASRWPGSA